MDLKWPEMPSKVNFGHPKWPPKKKSVSIWNGQKCDRKWNSEIQNGRSIWNGQKCDRKWNSDIQNGRRQPLSKISKKIKLRIDVKWIEMRSKVIFGHPKWPPVKPFCKKNQNKNLYWSKMARNVIQSEFRISKTADGSHFVKNFKTN